MKIGLMVPAVNTVSEPEFASGAPEGVTVHTARMWVGGTRQEDVHAMVADSLPRATRDIASIRPDVVVLACTAVGAVLGPDGEAELVAELQRDLGVPVVSMNGAVRHALDRAHATRVAIITPYPDDVTQRVAASIEAAGMEVVVAAGMGFGDAFDIAAISPEALVAFVTEHVGDRSFDALFLSCGNLRVLEARATLTARFGVPVVASNLAALDHAIELLAAAPAVASGEPTPQP